MASKLSELPTNASVRVDDGYRATYAVGDLIEMIKSGNDFGPIRLVKLKEIDYEPDGDIGADDIIERLNDEHSEWSEKNDEAVAGLRTCLNQAVAIRWHKYKDTTKVYDDDEDEIENDLLPTSTP